MVAQAKTVADLHGGAPAGFTINTGSIDTRLTTARIDLGVLASRQQQRSAIVSILERLMIEAATLDYDISNDDVFRALYAVACSEHSADYVPMRVLGHTAEAMIPPKRKNN
jgi:hypothetical protein